MSPYSRMGTYDMFLHVVMLNVKKWIFFQYTPKTFNLLVYSFVLVFFKNPFCQHLRLS